MEPVKVVTIRELMEELPGGQLYVALVEDQYGIRRLVANLHSVATYCGIDYRSLFEWVDEQSYVEYARTDNSDDRWYDRDIVEEFMLRALKGLLDKPRAPEVVEGHLSKGRPNNGRKKKTR